MTPAVWLVCVSLESAALGLRPIGQSGVRRIARERVRTDASRWHSFILLICAMKKNWPYCNDSINSAGGVAWMRNDIAWLAEKSLLAGKFR